MYYIYRIRNMSSGKSYIGITDDILRRWKSHYNDSKVLKRPLYQAIRKYGIENFAFSVIYECFDKIDALNKEIYYISEYKTIGKGGYNLSEGGQLPSENNKKINSERMKKDNPMTKLRTNNGSFKKGHKPKITPERNEKIKISKIGEKNHNYKNKKAALHMNTYIRCNYCDKVTNKGNYFRWHGENCKHKPTY